MSNIIDLGNLFDILLGIDNLYRSNMSSESRQNNLEDYKQELRDEVDKLNNLINTILELDSNNRQNYIDQQFDTILDVVVNNDYKDSFEEFFDNLKEDYIYPLYDLSFIAFQIDFNQNLRLVDNNKIINQINNFKQYFKQNYPEEKNYNKIIIEFSKLIRNLNDIFEKELSNFLRVFQSLNLKDRESRRYLSYTADKLKNIFILYYRKEYNFNQQYENVFKNLINSIKSNVKPSSFSSSSGVVGVTEFELANQFLRPYAETLDEPKKDLALALAKVLRYMGDSPPTYDNLIKAILQKDAIEIQSTSKTKDSSKSEIRPTQRPRRSVSGTLPKVSPAPPKSPSSSPNPLVVPGSSPTVAPGSSPTVVPGPGPTAAPGLPKSPTVAPGPGSSPTVAPGSSPKVVSGPSPTPNPNQSNYDRLEPTEPPVSGYVDIKSTPEQSNYLNVSSIEPKNSEYIDILPSKSNTNRGRSNKSSNRNKSRKNNQNKNRKKNNTRKNIGFPTPNPSFEQNLINNSYLDAAGITQRNSQEDLTPTIPTVTNPDNNAVSWSDGETNNENNENSSSNIQSEMGNPANWNNYNTNISSNRSRKNNRSRKKQQNKNRKNNKTRKNNRGFSTPNPLFEQNLINNSYLDALDVAQRNSPKNSTRTTPIITNPTYNVAQSRNQARLTSLYENSRNLPIQMQPQNYENNYAAPAVSRSRSGYESMPLESQLGYELMPPEDTGYDSVYGAPEDTGYDSVYGAPEDTGYDSVYGAPEDTRYNSVYGAEPIPSESIYEFMPETAKQNFNDYRIKQSKLRQSYNGYKPKKITQENINRHWIETHPELKKKKSKKKVFLNNVRNNSKKKRR